MCLRVLKRSFLRVAKRSFLRVANKRPPDPCRTCRSNQGGPKLHAWHRQTGPPNLGANPSSPSQPNGAVLQYKLLQKVWELSPTSEQKLEDRIGLHVFGAPICKVMISRISSLDFFLAKSLFFKSPAIL